MDKLDERIKNSKEVIKESQISNPDDIYQKVKNKESKKAASKFIVNYNFVLRHALILLLMLAVIVSGISLFSKSGDGVKKEENTPVNPENPEFELGNANDKIKNVTSIEELKYIIQNSVSNDYSDEGVVPEAPEEEGDGSNGNDDIDTDHLYNTNVQVEGIDEADIVKVNGDYIYYVTNEVTSYTYVNGSYTRVTNGQNCMYILKAVGDDIEIIKKVILETTEFEVASNDEATVKDIFSYRFNDVLYTDKYIILNVTASAHSIISYVDSNGKLKSTTTNYRNYTELYLYDINTFNLVKKINVPGYLKTTRLIGNQLYVISNYTDYDSTNYNLIVPRYGIDDVFYDAELSDIYYSPNMGMNINSYLVVFRIVLNDEITIEDFYFLAPYTNNIYMSYNAIYVIKSYSNKAEVEDNKVTNWPTTKVFIINIKGSLSFDGLIEVKGNINDKYWIDEYNGYLRIASTGRSYSYKVVGENYRYDSTSEVFNHLTIFSKNTNGEWEEVSSITEGLGEIGESLKSARFNGNVATLVTFRQTDPLYYVDLTDPKNPVITSELKISGFTVYQHPYKENYVIGIGYEADSNGRTTGFKVALFDVADKYNIKQVGNAVVFSYGDFTGLNVLSNPKELFLDLDNDIFGFSIFSYKNSNYRYYYNDNYYLFKIDLNSQNPISIIHIETADDYTSGFDYYKRMVFIKDKYYLLSFDSVMVYKLHSDGITLLKEKQLIK